MEAAFEGDVDEESLRKLRRSERMYQPDRLDGLIEQ
jgi:hypothetical protein